MAKMESTSNGAKSRLEINFVRLLEETQQMANGNKLKDWSFEKYVGWLQEKIPEMEKSPNSPNEELLKHYKRQVDFLRGVLEAQNCSEVLQSSTASQLIPHGTATTDHNIITQQIHQRTKATTTNRLREELLGLQQDDDSDDVLIRNRKGVPSDDFHSQLLSEEQRRDKLVEDMVAMTREWKEQSRVANKIITKDVESINKSSKIADMNQDHLKVESARLSDFNKRACNCWIWLMILFICFAFISMVLFIRLFPKRNL